MYELDNNDAFVQNASKMTKPQIAEYIWNSVSEDTFVDVLLESFKIKADSDFSRKLYLMVSDLIGLIEEGENKIGAYELLLNNASDETMNDIYHMIGTREGDAAEANAIDDAIDRSKGL